MVADFDVVVIGAGAAGLAAAKELMPHPYRILVIEARDRIGGRAHTVTPVPGLPVDLGCEWLHSADRNPWTRLARDFGFAIDDSLPDWGSRVARRDPALQRDWAAASDDFWRRLAEAAETAVDFPAADLLPPGGAWNGLLGAISTWINGTELDRVSVQDVGRYVDTGVNWRLRDGYGALIARFGAAVPVRFGTVVSEIDHGARPLRIITDQGTLTTHLAILTVPPPLLLSQSIRLTPALPDKLAAAEGIPLGFANKLFLEILGRAEDFPCGHHEVGSTERVATGSYNLRPHERPIVSAYFGGQLAADLEAAGPQGMAAFAIDELSDLYGSSVRARLKPLISSAWLGDPYAHGSYSHALPGHAASRQVLAAPVDNRLFFAGEACSADDFSTAHGAYRTGIAAAGAVLAALA